MKLHSSRLALGASVLAMTAVLAFAAPAMAADTTATLQGHVAGATAGAKVVAVDANTGQRVEVTVGADGQYVIIGLRPSTYHVSVGSDRQDVVLTVGETTNLDLNAAAATTTVTVIAHREQMRTAEVATSVSQTQIDRLPQLDRNFMNFAALAPGVSVSTDPNNKTFQAGATPATQVNVFIDGQSQKNQVLQGGTAGQDSSRGNPFPQSAVQEFKVSTQNFNAEYEQAGTAIITAVTKTGGNEFHGDVFDEIETKGMSGQPYFTRLNVAPRYGLTGEAKPDFHRSQYGIDLSGPIIKDVLHFFVTYEGDDEVHPSVAVNMPTAGLQTTNTSLMNYLKGLNGSYADPYNEKLFFGKLTYTPTDADTIDLSYFNRTESNQQAFGNQVAYSAGSNLDQFLHNETLSWKHRGDNWLNEVDLEQQSYHWRQSNTSHANDISLVDNPISCDTCAWAQIGGPDYTQLKSQDDVTFKDTLTYTGFDWHGHHVIKAGLKYAAYKYNAAENLYQYYYDGNTYSVGGTNTPVAATVNLGNPDIKTNNDQWGLFIQDSWTVNDHLEADYGIRWDYESDMLNDKYVTPAPIAAAIRSFVGFAAAGFNPNDYISTGSNRKPITNMFAPRLGLSYDIYGDHKWVIFGGAGRYYDRTINDDVQLETRRAYAPQVTLQFCSTSVPATAGTCIPWNSSYATQAGLQNLASHYNGEIYAMNNNTKVPYNDQFDIGLRHQFEGNITASITASEILGHNLFTWVLGDRIDNAHGQPPVPASQVGQWCQYGNQYSCAPWSYNLPGYGNFLISTDDSKSTYEALYFTVDKPYTRSSHYGYSGTLTLTDAKADGNSTEFAFDYADPSDTGMHPAPGVDKLRFVGTFIQDLPYGLQLSGELTLASGQPFDSISTTNPGGTVRIIPDGFYPKNGMAYQDLDLRLSKDFALPNGQVVTIDGQLYNVFDSVNRTYSGWGGGFNGGSGATREGDFATTGNPRTFQVGLKYKF